MYALINIFDKSIPFIIIPILTRIISKEEMGNYTLYQALFQILIPILTMSFDSAILINFYKLKKQAFNKYFSTGIILTIFFYFSIATLGFVFSGVLSRLFALPVLWIQVTMAIVLLQFFSQLIKNLWRAEEKPIKYGSYSIPLTLSKNLLGLFFVLYLNYSWEGIILGHFCGQFIFSIIAIIYFIKNKYLQSTFQKVYIKDLFKISFPISIHRISTWFGTVLNRLIINFFLGKAATGSYGIGAVFSVIVTVIGDAVNQAYVPHLYNKLKTLNSKTEKHLVKLTYVYYSFYILLFFTIYAIGYFGVGFIFGSAYNDTKSFIFPLILSATVNGLYKIHVNYILFTKKTQIIARISIICGLINVIISYINVKHFGLIGAAYSALIIQIIMYFYTFHYSNKLYPMPWLYIIQSKKH